jgi:DNA replication protein DnaC
MENLGDILKRLANNNSISEDSAEAASESPGEQPAPCDVCGGRGWFTRDVPVGHPEFGEVINCDCQQDRLERQQFDRLLRYSNLESFTRFTFQTLDPQGQGENPESRRLFEEAHQAAEQFAESPRGWLVFHGPHGSGKTHLAAAIGNRCISAGHLAFFVHVPDLLDHLRASFGPTSEMSYSDLFEQVRNSPLLILDGLGTHTTTSWAEEKLRQIVNHRYNAGLPTVVTVSGELGDIDPYLLSRLRTPGLSRVIQVTSRQPERVHLLGRIEPQMLRRMTFDTFDVRGNNLSAGQRTSLEAAYQFARNYAADPDGWLTLFGETGVGKTHLAVAIAAQQIEKGRPVFFFFVPELLDYLRHSFNPESRFTYDRLFEEVKTAPLLILDDLGQEQSSPWANEKLYQIIVHRHNARLPTVVTSMKDFTEDRGPIGSRVQDHSTGEMIRIDATDYRKKERGTPRTRRGTRARGARHA